MDPLRGPSQKYTAKTIFAKKMDEFEPKPGNSIR